MTKPIPLHPGGFYHLYNRGNNRETLFRERRNYRYFLQLYAKYIEPVAATYAYCLLPNHFHFLVEIKTGQDWQSSEDCQSYVSRQFANLFSTYTKAINKAYQRTGSLFEKPFQRKLVDNNRYLRRLLVYIHQNPVRHGLVDHPDDWPWSSYTAIAADRPTRVRRTAPSTSSGQAVGDWFGGRSAFVAAHKTIMDEAALAAVMIEDS